MALITDRAAAQRSRDHCAAEREEHRLNEEVAAQTARAAQATEQAAQEAYQQARLAWTQALLLLVALGASIWAATAASRAAKAADETLRHAEDTAKRQLRAYVSMISCELAFMREGGRPKAVVIVQNTGQTPAYRFGGLLGIKPIGSDRQPEFPAIDLSDVPRRILGSGAQHEFDADLGQVLTAEVLRAYMGGHIVAHVSGTLEYFDVFGDRHTTGIRLQGGSGASVGRLKPYKDGNDAT